MVTRIRKLLVIGIAVAIAIAVILLNLEPITVHITPSTQFTAVAGVVLLITFALGIAFAAVFWIFFGIKAYFRERELHNKEKQRTNFYQAMLQARGFLAANEWKKARDKWESMIKKDPTDIIARVELSHSLEEIGDEREALKILDIARGADPNNIEVLFRAAELNLKLGNNTAAIDNLALILYHQPNFKAAKLACRLSEELERIEDAIEYHNQLESLGINKEESKEILTRLHFKKLLSESQDAAELHLNVKRFVKKHPEFVLALHKLAKLEAEAGNIDEAAQHLVKAARISGSETYWDEATRLWIDNQLASRAVAAAKTATRNTKGRARIIAELNWIRLNLTLEESEEAKKALDKFQTLVKNEAVILDKELSHQYLALNGYCLNKLGAYQEAAQVWESLCELDLDLKESIPDKKNLKTASAPNPSLSTA